MPNGGSGGGNGGGNGASVGKNGIRVVVTVAAVFVITIGRAMSRAKTVTNPMVASMSDM